MNKYLVTICATALFFIAFTSSNKEQNNYASESTIGTTESINNSDVLKGKKIEEKEVVEYKSISQIKDIEEIRQAINNTVWTHTTRGDAWLRYEFAGNTVKQYGALPRSGEWRYDGDSQFELRIKRSDSDGKRFIVATFMPKTESLAIFESPVEFNFRDYHLYLNGQDIGSFIMADYKWD